MKLIIDIPDNEYKYTCERTLHDRSIWDDAIRKGTPLDDVKAEIREKSFDHYFEYGEYIGEDCRKEKIIYLDQVLEILDNIGKAES